MLNFLKIYEFFFKSSFNVRWDTQQLEELERDWQQLALIIKRSWFFGLYYSILLVWAFLVMLVNVFLAYKTFENETTKYIVIAILVWNVLIAIFSSLRFLRFFRRISWIENKVEQIHSYVIKSKEWDELFIKFFNQATLNYFMFIGLIGFHLFNFRTLFNFEDSIKMIFGIVDIGFLVLQAYLIQKYRKKMIDLEMDYNIVSKNKIIFANQSNMISDKQTIEWNKIKTIKSSYSSKILAFFKVWNIEILTEWDQNNLWAMSMQFVNLPDKTVSQIHKALEWKMELIEDKYKNSVFNEIVLENWYSVSAFYSWELSKEKMRDLFNMNFIQKRLKKLYETWTDIHRKEIRQIYAEILQDH